MSKVLIYHNPRWSKSRESVKILDSSDNDYEIVDYIHTPPTANELQSLADKMDIRAKDFIRRKEAIFKELDLGSHLEDDSTLFKYMAQHPKLIERPIIVKGNRAVLGRPPKKVEEFLNS